MATYDPDRPNVATGSGSVPTKKTKKKTKVNAPAPGQVPVTGYDWGDGKGARHTITLKAHQANVKAKQLAPYDIGAGYDPETVRNTVNGAADLEYGQPIATAQGQIADSQRNIDVNIPGWYQQYITAVGNARAATAAEYAKAGAATAPGQVAPTGDPTVDQAAQVRAGMQGSFQGLINAQGANNTASYDAQGANAALMRVGSLQDETRNKQTLTSGLGQLQKEKGEYGNQYLQKMRESAQQTAVDQEANRVAAAASGQKLDFDNNGIADTVDAAKASQAAAATKADNQVTKWGYTTKEWRNLSEAQRNSIIKAQNPPKSSKEENTKDYFGHTYDEWKKMTYSQRRTAIKNNAQDKSTSKAGGVSTAASTANTDTWKNALDYIRTNSDKKTGDYPDARELVDRAGIGKFTIAEIAAYYGSHGGKVTAAQAKTLKDKFGIDTPAQNIKG